MELILKMTNKNPSKMRDLVKGYNSAKFHSCHECSCQMNMHGLD